MTSPGESTTERLKRAVERFVQAGPQVAGDEDPALIVSLFPSRQRKNADHGLRPWHREDLYRRLHTYKVSTWFCKPEAAGPLACALHGWINTGIDLLSCEVCRSKLSLQIPALLPHEKARQLAEGFAAKLQSGHGETCTWRTGGCNPQLACFPPITPDAALAGFHRRASSIAALGALPCLQLQPGTLPASLWSRCRRRLHLLLTPGFQPGPQAPSLQPIASMNDSPSKPDFPLAALPALADPAPASGEGLTDLSREQKQQLLALFGWNLREPAADGSSQPLLFCTMCGVKAGLWNFTPDATDPAQGWRPGPSVAGRGRQQISSPGFGDFTIAGGNLQTGPSSSAGVKRPFGSGSFSAFGSSPAMNGAGEPEQGKPGPTGSPVASTANQVLDGKANGHATPTHSVPAAVQPFGLRSSSSAVPAFGLEALRTSSSLAASQAATSMEAHKDSAFKEGLEQLTPNGHAEPLDREGEADERSAKRLRISTNKHSPGDGPLSTARSGFGMPCPPPAAFASWLHGEETLDPLKLHRPFCPWVNGNGRAGQQGSSCGWQYCLQLLVPLPADQEEDGQAQPQPEEGMYQSPAQQRLEAQIRKIQTSR
ncbi:hypothetical protein WJX84_003641 [Apatococcus fuscideae]|uniref:C3HC-type domain-containing protein n=1 Tax=Apatococcus fuscideae TaxID=2026836 RepID=A0AAW1SK06_9CHLO